MDYNFLFLKEVSDIIKRYEAESLQKGNNVNILQITGKDHNEVVICRLLAFLLNPNEKHNYGAKFLNLFLEEIGESPVSIEELKNLAVLTEFPTNKGRRIDLVIQSKNRFIPFEVKIYATDQKEQCIHYYEFSNERYKAEKVYYLTPDGHEPDESSKGGSKLINGQNLKCISFRKEILNWIEVCEKDCGVCNKLIYELKIAIRKFCGLLENMEMTNEILDKILEDEDSFTAAKAIYAVGKEINQNILWENFCNNIGKNTLGDWHQYPSPEADNPEAISVYLHDDTIRIEFYESFSWLYIDVTGKDLVNKIFDGLKSHFEDFNYGRISDNGFVINNTSKFFIDNSSDSPFDFYKLFTKQKDDIIKKMQEFIGIVERSVGD